MVEEFKMDTRLHGFSYVFDRMLGAGETVIVKMPPVTANKRGINDIGWQTDGWVTLYGTLCKDPARDDVLWQEIEPLDEVNKTVSALKVVNNGETSCRVIIRAILN